MKAFMQMDFFPINSFSSLCLFYDSTESHICGLRSLGRSELTYGDLLIPVTKAKYTPKYDAILKESTPVAIGFTRLVT